MVKVGEVRDLEEGEILVRTGQNIRSAFLVVEGLIKIYREDDQGDEYFMYYLDGGKACAVSLVCALGQETSEVLARAVTGATILTIPLRFINEWMGKYKSWAQFALNTYRERFEELLRVIDHIAFRNMDERLIFYLKRYQEKVGTNLFTSSFTEIAQELNSSREVISRLMRKLAERGIVQLHGTHIELLDLDRALS